MAVKPMEGAPRPVANSQGKRTLDKQSVCSNNEIPEHKLGDIDIAFH